MPSTNRTAHQSESQPWQPCHPPATPTHLALPPRRRRGGGALPFRCADGGCGERSPCALAHTRNQSRGQPCVYLFIILLLFFFPPLSLFSPPDSGHGAMPPPPPPPPFPEPLPLPLSHLWCGSSHFLAATCAALALTRDTHDKLGVEVKVMGCESNAAAAASPASPQPLPNPLTVHTVDTRTKAA